GTVKTAKLLDREVDGASHTITVKATSADGSFTTKDFTIALGDVDEFNVGPITDATASADGVAENAAIGTAVGIKAPASDADATTTAITYSLDNSAGGRFSIARDGTIKTAKVLDREVDGASQTITVRASSADGSFSTKSFTIAI